MKIGLAQVDGKWPNLALMKISAYYKREPYIDSVGWFSPLEKYDTIYASKIFNFTPDDLYLPEHTIKGGTGYDIKSKLNSVIEACFPDYSLYPSFQSAMGFTTRGCVRKCSFCLVPAKEGKIKVVGELHNFWNGQKTVILLDRNLTAAPLKHFQIVLNQLIDNKLKVDFSQGLDIRLIKDNHAYMLAKVSLMKQIHFAWDSVDIEQQVRKGINLLKSYMPLSRIMFYVLIGYNSTPEEDMHRIEVLRSLKVDSFAMPYNKTDPYQKAFARWVNHKAIFKTVAWKDYNRK